MSEKVSVELGIEEVMALVDYNWEMFNGIPKESYPHKNMAGTTMEDTAKKYKTRAQYWQNLLDDTWPK